MKHLLFYMLLLFSSVSMAQYKDEYFISANDTIYKHNNWLEYYTIGLNVAVDTMVTRTNVLILHSDHAGNVRVSEGELVESYTRPEYFYTLQWLKSEYYICEDGLLIPIDGSFVWGYKER